MLRTIYKFLSLLSLLTSISKGRGGRSLVRRAGIKSVMRGTRRMKW